MRPKSAKQPGAQGLITSHAKTGNSNLKAPNAFGQRFGYGYGNIEVQSRDRLPNEEQILKESLRFKQDANNFKLENIQLKTRIQQYEKEIEKKNKLIKSIMEQRESTQEGMFVKRQFDGETSTVLNLKRLIKELREDIKAKDELITGLTKNVKTAKIEEIELRIKVDTEECRKLRETLKEVIENEKGNDSYLEEIRQIEEKLQEQSVTLANIRKENEQMEIIVKRKDAELIELQEKATRTEAQRKKYLKENKEFTKSKIRLLNEKKTLDKLRQQVAMLKVNKNEQPIEVYKIRIENLIKQQKELEEVLESKEKEIERLKEECDPNKLADKRNNLYKEISKLKAESKQCIHFNYSVDEDELEKMAKAKKPLEKAKAISIKEAEIVAMDLKYALMNLGISSGDIEKRMFKGYSSENTISIYEFTRLLIRITRRTKSECESLARYIIEQKTNELQELNIFLEAKVGAVCKKLKELMGNFSIINNQNENAIKQQLSKVNTKLTNRN